jgi:hypothetical protein
MDADRETGRFLSSRRALSMKKNKITIKIRRKTMSISVNMMGWL